MPSPGKVFRLMPIEIYTLVIFPLIGIVVMGIISSVSFSLKTIIFYFLFGGYFLYVGLIILYVYFLLKLILLAKNFFIKGYSKKKAFKEISDFVKSYFSFSLILLSSSYFLDVMMNYLSIHTPDKSIIFTSNYLMASDFFIFKIYPMFQMSEVINAFGGKIISYILVNAYNLASFFIAVLVFILFLCSKPLAKKFIIFFFVVQIISLPVWYILPAIEPSRMYLQNPFGQNFSEPIAAQVKNYKPDSILNDYQQQVFSYYKKTGGYYALTTFPSMHTAWGAGMVFYAFLLWPPLGLVFFSWFILEITGAIYVGQHYIVDIILGVGFACIAVLFTELLLFFEKKYYIGNGSFAIVNFIQEDVSRAKGKINIIWNLALKSWKKLRRTK